MKYCFLLPFLIFQLKTFAQTRPYVSFSGSSGEDIQIYLQKEVAKGFSSKLAHVGKSGVGYAKLQFDKKSILSEVYIDPLTDTALASFLITSLLKTTDHWQVIGLDSTHGISALLPIRYWLDYNGVSVTVKNDSRMIEKFKSGSNDEASSIIELPLVEIMSPADVDGRGWRQARKLSGVSWH